MWSRPIPKQAVVTHVFLVIFFLVVPFLVFTRLPDESLFTVSRPIVQDSVANFILLIFFYLNYYLFLPGLYFKQKYLPYVLCVLASLLAACLIPNLLTGELPFLEPMRMPDIPGHVSRQPPPNKQMLFFPFVLDEFKRHLYLFFTAVFFSFLLRMRERVDEIKEEKLKAELASLKSQINPHFLFNTLNNIYTLSVKKDDRVSDAIIHLSGIMRYAIRDANDAAIPLCTEVDYIEHYLELQKSRLGNTASILFTCHGEPGGKFIAPLLLITYIENAFKYGVNPDAEDCVVKIQLTITDTGVKLYTFNKKVQSSEHLPSTGIGMSNTQERLLHLYPKRHTLLINETDDTYSVNLSIQLV